jgi:carboxymethylenebutenolidase
MLTVTFIAGSSAHGLVTAAVDITALLNRHAPKRKSAMPDSWTISVPDGEFSAYVARPQGEGPWPAVVAIQEIFGVNAVMREACDSLAAQGFLAICPDLFWRLEPGIELTDKTKAEWGQALKLMGRFDVDKGIEDIRATIARLRAEDDCTGKVGDVGYCLGGKLAFLAACRTDADASVSYYGVGLEALVGEAAGLDRPLMLHIAGEDSFSSKEAQAAVVEALGDNPHVTIHIYPGRDHAFARPGGEHHHHEDAALANARTLAFLNAALR